MKKLFDLGFVIGIFFLILGVLLVVYSFFIKGEPHSITIDRVCGIIFLAFALVMLFLSRKSSD